MNQKTNVAITCIALALGALSVSGQTAAPAPAPEPASSGSWVITPSFASQYMFRGARLGGPSFEPTIEYDNGPFAIGVWANFPLADKVVGQSDPEIDPYGSYTIELQKDVMTLVPGFTLYTYPNADKNNGFYKMTFEPNIALNYSFPSGFKLTPKLYYDFVLKGPTAEMNASFAVPLKDAGTELDFVATYGTFKWTEFAENTSPSVKNWGNYYLVGVSLPFQVTKESKVTVGFAYTKGTDNFLKQGTAPKVENSGAVGRGVVTLAYSYTF